MVFLFVFRHNLTSTSSIFSLYIFSSLSNALYLFVVCPFSPPMLLLYIVLLVLIIFPYFFDNKYSFCFISRQWKKFVIIYFFLFESCYVYVYGVIFAHIPKMNSDEMKSFILAETIATSLRFTAFCIESWQPLRTYCQTQKLYMKNINNDKYNILLLPLYN